MKVIFFTLCAILYAHIGLAQNTVDKLFILGNSTIDHRPPAIPTPSDETTVPHWIYLLAQEAGANFSVGGQYGFLTNFDDLNWFSQWGYDLVPSAWESDMESYADAGITTLMMTNANFIQYQSPAEPHPLDASTSVVNATQDILDYSDAQQSGIKYYLYENWPEMDLASAYPPTVPPQTEINDFHNQTTGIFHDWWLEYQDSLLSSRPALNLRLIPVGSVLSKIIRDLLPGQIPFEELYEDSAPHGRASLYFLASLVSYMGMFEEKAPSSFVVPEIIHPAIEDNYSLIVDFIWNELITFNDANGNSRVFCQNILAATDLLADENDLILYPNPTAGYFTISGILSSYNIDILDANGAVFQNVNTNLSLQTIDIFNLPEGLFFVRIENVSNGNIVIQKILKAN